MNLPSRSRLVGWALPVALLTMACTSAPPPNVDDDADEAVSVPQSAGALIRGRAPRATGGFPSVVILTPDTDDEIEFPVPLEPALMDQYNTEFNPNVLIVRAGQKVQFKNSEDTLHNVHVIDTVTRDTAFNVATPVTGAFEHVFDAPAVYDVSCGIHPSMAAFVVVVDSPYAVVANADGTFSLPDVPPGAYTAAVWNLEPSRRSERRVTIEGDMSELTLDGMS